MTEEELSSFGSRRDFFKKMLALGFAVPVISSFALDGVASANPTKFPNSTFGNQRWDDDHDDDDDESYRRKHRW